MKKNDKRCPWCLGDTEYISYHDHEWGVPEYDSVKLFEFLVLEGMQAGLSWLTVLKKREAFRRAFDAFNPESIAEYGPKKISVLLKDPSIIRNRLKINSAVSNARAFLEISKKRDFSEYIWQFTGGKRIINTVRDPDELPCSSKISDTMSGTLKKDGFKFCGTVICYSFMQSTGMVNVHLTSCVRYRELS